MLFLGSLDPYSRASRSPKQKSRPQGFESFPQATASEDFKAPPPTPPVVDQVPVGCRLRSFLRLCVIK